MQFCQKLNEKAEIPDSLGFRNHCWRELGIGQIANDPSVTDPERMSFARHTNASSHLAYVRSGHNSDYAFQKSVSGAPMPTKKNILLQQAAMKRAVKKATGNKRMPLKACPIPQKAVPSKPKIVRKAAQKPIPKQAPTHMKAPPSSKRSTPATRRSLLRRSARLPKHKKRL
jgi:hypothetical protein